MTKQNDEIILSPKHGVNPTILHCVCCGKDYGLGILGKLKNDEKAPKDSYYGLCDNCQKVVDDGGVLIIEITDGSAKSENPYRTGRILGCSKAFKERNNIEAPLCYMAASLFSELFDEHLKQQKEKENEQLS
jgi:predicted hydrocarbon binding protein